jgi:lipoprotein-anchoring transpeptidase ErfK/SrfK
LLLQDDDGNVRMAPLAAEMADRLGIETKRVRQNDLPLFDESLFWTAPNPYGAADPDAPGMKRVEVSIGEQTMRAYQGDELVLETFVSTGLAPNFTEKGLFHIRYKLPKEDMRGFTSATGEVVGLGDGSGQQSGAAYAVKDVPHVMYINNDAEALHGAYWHNNFGQQMSHGCINQPLDVAAFMFGWAPLGTQVWVHD